MWTLNIPLSPIDCIANVYVLHRCVLVYWLQAISHVDHVISEHSTESECVTARTCHRKRQQNIKASLYAFLISYTLSWNFAKNTYPNDIHRKKCMHTDKNKSQALGLTLQLYPPKIRELLLVNKKNCNLNNIF